jgi:hypothetical protein
MPSAEAMAMGVPAIVTNWSGAADFVDEEVGYPIRYTLRDVPDSNPWWFHGARWAYADVTHLREVGVPVSAVSVAPPTSRSVATPTDVRTQLCTPLATPFHTRRSCATCTNTPGRRGPRAVRHASACIRCTHQRLLQRWWRQSWSGRGRSLGPAHASAASTPNTPHHLAPPRSVQIRQGLCMCVSSVSTPIYSI